jgi:3D (Asp-Asp-Asp) domain-containing protein
MFKQLLFFLFFSISAYSDYLSNPTKAPVVGKFKNTYYYIIDESDEKYLNLPRTEKILDAQDNILAYVSLRFKRDLIMEGSGKLLDGRVVNFDKKINNESRFHITPFDFGRGVGNCPLIPYYTVAIDPKIVPLGSLLYIDELVGMKLPDGSIHNGFVWAHDIGSAIQNYRIDIFVGFDKKGEALLKHQITHLKPLTVRIIKNPEPSSCIYLFPY